MTHPYYPTGNPHFNHVAMSMPADLLDEGNRTDICAFWSEVFGFDGRREVHHHQRHVRVRHAEALRPDYVLLTDADIVVWDPKASKTISAIENSSTRSPGSRSRSTATAGR